MRIRRLIIFLCIASLLACTARETKKCAFGIDGYLPMYADGMVSRYDFDDQMHGLRLITIVCFYQQRVLGVPIDQPDRLAVLAPSPIERPCFAMFLVVENRSTDYMPEILGDNVDDLMKVFIDGRLHKVGNPFGAFEVSLPCPCIPTGCNDYWPYLLRCNRSEWPHGSSFSLQWEYQGKRTKRYKIDIDNLSAERADN